MPAGRGFVAGLAAAALLSLPATAGAAGTLVGDYRFDDTRASSVAGAPNLTDVGAAGPNAFATEQVGGCSDRVLAFAAGNGLALPTAGLVPQDSYSIIVRFRFAEVSGYRRVINFDPLDVGDGLYGLDGKLVIRRSGVAANEAGSSLAAGAYGELALTRTAAGQVNVYVGGAGPVLTYSDSFGVGLLDNPPIGVFFDEDDQGGAGAVSRIRVYDDALSASEVSAAVEGCAPPATRPKAKKKCKKKQKRGKRSAAPAAKKKKKCKKGRPKRK